MKLQTIKEVPREILLEGKYVKGEIDLNYLIFLLTGFCNWTSAQSGLHIKWFRNNDLYCALFYSALFNLRT